MRASYIIDFLRECEILKDFDILVDFMDLSDKCVLVKCENKDRIIKKYADGECVFGYEFSIISKFSGMEKENLKNMETEEKLIEWILNQNKTKFRQTADFMPVKIHLLGGPVPYDDNAKSIKYKINLRFDYIKK